MKRMIILVGLFLLLISCQPEKPDRYELTDDEQAWLDAHPVIYYATDPEFAPYEYYDENQIHTGLVPDYLVYMENILGVDIKLKYTDTWSNALEMGRNNEVNFLFMTETVDRAEFFYFTRPFIFSPNVLLINSDYDSSISFDNMADFTFGVLTDYSSKDYFKLIYPQAKTEDYDTIIEGIFALSSGKVDAFLADLGQTSYYINKYDINQISVYDSISYDFQFTFAVNKEYEPLVGILDKALASMTAEQHKDIKDEWFQSEYKNWLNKGQTRLIYIGAITITITAAILLLLIFIMRSIIKNKTNELEIINLELEKRVLERTQEIVSVNGELEISIMELINTQEKLITSEKYASLGKIVASVAHELNTPLGTSITSVSYGKREINKLITKYQDSTLSKLCFEDTSAAVAESFETTSSYLKRIAKILDQFKRLEATLISNTLEQVNLKDCIEQSIKQINVRDMIPEGFDIELDIDENIELSADQLWIDEIVINIVLNAILHGKLEKDTICITAKQNDYLTLTFEDHGIGISPSDQKKIFEPFYKNPHEHDHIGLGLSIVYNIVVNNLLGSIEIDSKSYDKTSFMIKIPVEKPQ